MIALLDTTAYTALMRGDEGILKALSEADRILMSVIVIGELEYGFRHGQRYKDNRAQLDEWLAETYVDFITADPRYGDQVRPNQHRASTLRSKDSDERRLDRSPRIRARCNAMDAR